MIAPPTFAKGLETNVRVFLDRVEQPYVIEYDTDAGYLLRPATEDGVVPFVKTTADGRWIFERVEGVVEVMWSEYPS